MQRALLITALWLLAFTGHAQPLSQPLSTPSNITEVTVFPDRALVTRTARVDLPAGPSTVEIAGLPHTLDVDSVRISGQGKRPFTIINLEIRQRFAEQLVSEQEQQLTEQLDDLNDQRLAIEHSIAALNDQLAFIRNIGRQTSDNITDTLTQRDINPERWREGWTAIGEGVTSTYREIRQAQNQQRQLTHKIKKTEQELNRIRTNRRESRVALVNIDAPQAAQGQLVVQYQVFNVSWAAQYDARLDSNRNQTTLTQFATVRQRSGEAWRDITLRISTARPSGRVAPPQLGPWFIDFPPPARPEPILREERARLPAAKSLAVPEAESDFAAGMATAQAQAGEFATLFTVPGNVTVPTDGEPHRFAIANHTLESTVTLRTVPKLDPTAFVYTETRYDGETPLTAGTLNLFRDDAYIGRGYLPLTRPNETIKLALGADERLKVKYNLETGQRSSEGIFNLKRRVERHYRIDIENYHQRDITITVLDQLPVGQDERIKVELLRNATAPTQHDVDDKKGVVAWTRTLAAGEQSTLHFSYAVIYPEDQQLPGF